MDNLQSRASSFADHLTALASSNSSSSENSWNSSNNNSSSGGSSFGGSSFGSTSTGTTIIPNPFYIGNLSSTDQDKLRNALSRPF